MQLMTPKGAEALRRYAQYLDDHAEADYKFTLRVIDNLSPELCRMRWALWWLWVRVCLVRAWDVCMLLLIIACLAVGVAELLRRIMGGM
jgi:hypothetical protein